MVKGYVGDGHYRVNIGVGAATIDAHESKLTAITDLPTGSLSTGRAESSSTSSENDDLARLALSGSAHTSPGQAPGSSSSSSSAPLRSPFSPRSSALRSPRAAAHLDATIGTPTGGDAADGPLSRTSSRVSMAAASRALQQPPGGTDTGGAAAPPAHALSSSSGPELALITSLRASLGAGFKLQPGILPDPKFKQDYHLKFGTNRQFWFQQVDYGVKFEPFLGLDYVKDPEVVTSCPSALENFRCMFLHLGVGIEVHPFVLQVYPIAYVGPYLSLPRPLSIPT